MVSGESQTDQLGEHHVVPPDLRRPLFDELGEPIDWSWMMPTSQRCQLASLSSRLTVLRSSPSSRAAPWRILFAPCSRTWSAPHSAPPPDMVGGRHLQRRHLHPDSSSSDLVQPEQLPAA